MDNMAYICLYKSYLRTLSTLTDAQFGKLFRSLLLFSQDGQQPSLNGPLRHVWPGIAEQYLRDAQQYETKAEASRRNGAKGGRGKKADAAQPPDNTQGYLEETQKTQGYLEETQKTQGFLEETQKTQGFLEKPKKPKEKEKEKEKDKEKEKESAKEKETVSIPPAGRGAGREEAAGPVSGALAFLPPTLDTIAAYIKAQGLDAKAEEFWDYYEARGWKMGASPMQDWKAALRAWARAERRFTNGKADAERVFSQGARYGDFGAVV